MKITSVLFYLAFAHEVKAPYYIDIKNPKECLTAAAGEGGEDKLSFNWRQLQQNQANLFSVSISLYMKTPVSLLALTPSC